MKRIIVMLSVIPAAWLLAGCGASADVTTPTPTAVPVTGTPAATTTPATTPTAVPPAVDLSGSWSGQYSGPFNGTFTLTWSQSGPNVNGTIVLSSPPKTLHVNGNVGGTAITFGAVGGVVYTGSVSGNSMSGQYQVPGAGAAGSGTWSATKS